jgi:RimJ/RimL family protein N-acetyltransferase
MTTDTETVDFRHKPVLTGDRVVLRPVETADAPGLAEILLDPELRRLTGTHGTARPGVLERAQKLYATRSIEYEELWLAVTDAATGDYLGEIVLDGLDAANRSCNFRICLVGERAVGKGYGTEAIRLLLAHAFTAAGLNRIGLEVYAFNPRARHVYERVGFTHEGTKRQALLWDGEAVDAHTMAILADDWRRANPLGSPSCAHPRACTGSTPTGCAAASTPRSCRGTWPSPWTATGAGPGPKGSPTPGSATGTAPSTSTTSSPGATTSASHTPRSTSPRRTTSPSAAAAKSHT